MTLTLLDLPEPKNWDLPMIPEFPLFFKLSPIAKAVEQLVIKEYGDKFLHCCSTTIALQIKEYFQLTDDDLDLLRLSHNV